MSRTNVFQYYAIKCYKIIYIMLRSIFIHPHQCIQVQLWFSKHFERLELLMYNFQTKNTNVTH